MFHGGDIKIGDEEGSRLYQALRRRGDLFLATTERYARGRLLSFGFPAEKILVHRIGIAVRDIEFRVRPRPLGPCQVLSVARLVPEKGIDIAIRAVAALRQARPAVPLEYRIVGDGPERDTLRRLASELGVSDAVQLLGPMPSTDVLKWMRDCHLFLLPSLAEPFGTVLLEAQASGMPIVATRAGGAPEAVREESALLVPPADVPATAAALRRLVEHPEEWERMGRCGREFVEGRHDIEALDARLADVLGALVADRGRRGHGAG
jgi:colanic acid/amylovoran biosynthesis glycosyltransferase